MKPVLKPEECVIVTRYSPFAEYVQEIGICPRGATILQRPRPEEIAGKVVFGPIPPGLAIFARAVVTVPMERPRALREGEVTLEELRRYGGKPLIFQSRRVEEATSPDLAAAARAALSYVKTHAPENIARALEAAVYGKSCAA
jgi:hypothetical protein